LTGARHTNSEILPRLIQVAAPHVISNDAINIRNDFASLVSWPSFENNYFIELLTLCLVHVHHDNTALWTSG